MFGGNDNTSALLKYLKAHKGSAKYLMATFGTMTAAPYITASGENIVPIGGFDGSDPSPTLKQVKTWIAKGDLKYVLASVSGMGGGMSSMGGGMSGMTGNTSTSSGKANDSSIQSWVTSHCTLSGYSGGSLYECTPASLK
jgi:hypothetical protein